jgi:hypothetical protein
MRKNSTVVRRDCLIRCAIVSSDGNVAARVQLELTVDFIDRYENPVSTMTFSFDPGAQVMLEDERHAPASKLEPGEKLLVWMPENRLGFYAEPGAMASKHFALVSESAPEKR